MFFMLCLSSRHISFSLSCPSLFSNNYRYEDRKTLIFLLQSNLSNCFCLGQNFLLLSFCLTYCAIKMPKNKVQLGVKKVKDIHLLGSCSLWLLTSYLHVFPHQHCTNDAVWFKGWSAILIPISNFQQRSNLWNFHEWYSNTWISPRATTWLK